MGQSRLYVRHALLVRLEDAGYALKPVRERVRLLGVPCDMRYRQTCCPLIQYQLPRIDNFCQLFQQRLDGACVRYQIIYDLSPRLVQALVPDTRREELNRIFEPFASLPDVIGALVEHGLP